MKTIEDMVKRAEYLARKQTVTHTEIELNRVLGATITKELITEITKKLQPKYEADL